MAGNAKPSPQAFLDWMVAIGSAYERSAAEGEHAVGMFIRHYLHIYATALRADAREVALGNDIDFGRFTCSTLDDNNGILRTMRVYNMSEESARVVGVYTFPPMPGLTLDVGNLGLVKSHSHAHIAPSDGGDANIRRRSCVELRLRFNAPQQTGLHHTHLFVSMRDGSVVCRKILALVARADAQRGLNPSAAHFVPASASIRGRKPATVPIYVRSDLPPAPAQGEPLEHLQVIPLPDEGARGRLALLTPLSASNYELFFATLLEVEDLQMQKDIRAYDMHYAALSLDKSQRQTAFILHVPGLLESRPPVTYGDVVMIEAAGVHPILYEGRVYRIDRKSERLWLLVGSNGCHPHTALRFTVRFAVNRHPIYEMRRAMRSMSVLLHPPGHQPVASQQVHALVDGVSGHEVPSNFALRRLFPTAADFNTPWREGMAIGIKTPNFPFDWDQLKAVQAIVDWDGPQQLGVAPFVLHGPPGTGKTCTIVEAVAQIIARNPKARVLCVGPSNTAADVVCSRLAARLADTFQTEPNLMLRLNSHTRFVQEVPIALLKFCAMDAASFFTVPAMTTLVGHRIVVATCISAGLLVSAGLSACHFDYVFVDECAQATEPEVLVPLSLAGPKCKVVLSGDHSQLGPSIRSNACIARGLGTSLQERLMRLYVEIERNKPTAHCPHVALRKNYRSDGPMVSVPSALFYGGQIEVAPDGCALAAQLPWLPNQAFPMLFYSVEGEDIRQGDSLVSFNNPLEAIVIADIVERIFRSNVSRDFDANSGSAAHVQGDDMSGVVTNDTVTAAVRRDGVDAPLVQTDIGVISPFRAQVKSLRQLLRNRNLGAVDVGTVEDYQGQERKIVVLSTVRSQSTWLAYDRRSGMGLIGNPKRFNVGITRARSLLVAVGNPRILCRDANWRAFISHCARNSSVMGADCGDILAMCDAAAEKATASVQRMDSLAGGPASMASASRADALLDSLESTRRDAETMATLDSSRWLGRRAGGSGGIDDDGGNGYPILLPGDLDEDGSYTMDDDSDLFFSDDKEWRVVM